MLCSISLPLKWLGFASSDYWDVKNQIMDQLIGKSNARVKGRLTLQGPCTLWWRTGLLPHTSSSHPSQLWPKCTPQMKQKQNSIIPMPHSQTQWSRSQVTYPVTMESINPFGGIKHGQLCIYCRKRWNSKKENWLQSLFPHDWISFKLMQQDTECSIAGTNRISIYLSLTESNLTETCYWTSQ